MTAWRYLLPLTLIPVNVDAADRVDFQRDVRPILSDACFQCHGSDVARRQADLRLDVKAGLFRRRDGKAIIEPKRPDQSELLRRLTAHADEKMPPPEAERQLSKNEIQTVRRWIQEGAEWAPHWAFVPPRPVTIPPATKLATAGWSQSPIDRFILSRLQQHGLEPASSESRVQLARRASLTLTGLPPTDLDQRSIQRDGSPDAYERYVDRLLAAPAYGERQALLWLDLARYADTDGYQDDQPRVMWRWRDWLIDACNQGQGFDRFTEHVLAGDLLPNATDRQRLATGFHRNHRVNGEGGSIAEEFRVEYVVDCVETTATVWLGLTLGCARCHDHKYDPFTQRDFYRLFAIFNNSPEKGIYRGNGSGPLVKVPTVGQQVALDDIDRQLARAAKGSKEAKRLLAERKQLFAQVPTTMVLSDAKPRQTFILKRGQYDQRGETVSGGVPRTFVDTEDEDKGRRVTNRLELARWLMHPDNALTARVAVNRIWTQHFARGIVATPEDFGSQGQPPTHPLLLDWLAAHFVSSGWDVKGLHRLLLTSSTFRQTARVNGKARKIDAANRLLWRFPRHRLQAEFIRDRALAVSGLLVNRLGGPSVKPYQPSGLWDEIAGGSTSSYSGGYRPDKGAGLYRRSLYTFWRRTIPPPGMTTFDAPSRETCTARRSQTNTPLQALALLNDPTFLESARVLAESMVRSSSDVTEQVTFGFRAALSRAPSPRELERLSAAYTRFHERFRADSKTADALIRVGATAADARLDPIQVATCMSIANILLNLDEFVMIE